MASTYYIKKSTQNVNSENAKIALSTDDYDIMVPASLKDSFISNIVREIDTNTMFKLDMKENVDLGIYMLGYVEKGLFKSVIDIHCVQHKLPSFEVSDNNIRYVNKTWLCDDLLYSIKHRSSEMEAVKNVKRQARSRLLKCSSNSNTI
jgi:hypothetical protein